MCICGNHNTYGAYMRQCDALHWKQKVCLIAIAMTKSQGARGLRNLASALALHSREFVSDSKFCCNSMSSRIRML